MERVKGIEPSYAAWEVRLNQARSMTYVQNIVTSAQIRSSGYGRSAKLICSPDKIRFAPIADIQTITQVLILPHGQQIPAMHRPARQSWKGAACDLYPAL